MSAISLTPATFASVCPAAVPKGDTQTTATLIRQGSSLQDGHVVREAYRLIGTPVLTGKLNIDTTARMTDCANGY